MICEFCGGKTAEKKVKKQHWFNKKLFILDDVPAEVCKDCGERYYHAKTLDAIDQLLSRKHAVRKKLQVEVVRL